MRQIFSVFLFVLFLSLVGFAQETPSWVTEIEKNITQNEKTWETKKKDELIQENFFRYRFTVNSVKHLAEVRITQLKGVTNLEETFAGFIIIAENNLRGDNPKTALKDFGDEGFIWTNINKTNWARIQFRKKDVFIEVSSPSEAAARKVAKYVAEKLP
ncbi:MAG TPA: hypothetical protein VIL74_23010 [Pyrinomonadaceae bacterium]|jgi:hypothetical protein